MEAYYADNGTYDGATAEKLREIDAGVPDDLTVIVTGESYCLEESRATGTLSVTQARVERSWQLPARGLM
jgi:hypothetical protein